MVDDTIMSTDYVTTYTPSLLQSLPRNDQRQALGITEDALPFTGMDIWNAYEFNWLGVQGRPEVALAKFLIPCNSVNIVESKSLKLYLGSFSNTPFDHRNDVISTLEADLALITGSPVSVLLETPEQVQHEGLGLLVGHSLDTIEIEMSGYKLNPHFLEVESNTTLRESLYTHLFRAICPRTGQPDIASVLIQYNGNGISHEGLLKYLVSYREHAEFAEQITERIFIDVMHHCAPEKLAVSTRFARRGGIDINSQRVHEEEIPADVRVWRQ